MKSKIALPFLIGFAITFLALALFLPMFATSPSGGALARVPLWRYYVLEIPRLLGPQMLGSFSGGGGVLAVVLQHVGLALVGGAVVTGVAMLFGVRSRSS
ncbi:hypothetical protein NG895_20110 [Aeoliella sp. ICT_H6.2]|uniref:Uncharacterized protein n=1 Tax=Aeoliella straminimaris TaxID=2954799 RepID=A0A9X2FDI0_9BACT|nr:hypothetical protein [Aeoliella straminimaris]MCO6046208.1 hypothetical protein [Aeoliella straminimaris]